MSARTFALFMGALAVLALLGFGLVSKDTDALAVGEQIPDAELPRLEGEGSGSIADYRGDWVLVNVWASWCDPCRDEAPDLQSFYERHRADGFVVLGVDTKDASGEAIEFAEEFGLTYPQLHDGPGDFADDDLGTTGVPENFLVDPRGRLAEIWRTPVDERFLEERVVPIVEASR